MAIRYAGLSVELREIVFRAKPEAMLQASPKGTVPTLVLPDGSVLDESEEVMRWALQRADPDGWLSAHQAQDIRAVLDDNDHGFKPRLDRYKYADRHPEHSERHYRECGEVFLRTLEKRLTGQRYLLSDRVSFADVGVFPFIRQFAAVDKTWFEQASYPRLRAWLQGFLQAQLFTAVMRKYPLWQPGDPPIVFPSG